MTSRIAACFLFFALLVSRALAWNSVGHKVIAEIAWQQLDTKQRQNIVEVLRRHPTFATDFQAKMEDDPRVAKGGKAVQEVWIFQQAATWPDIIRKQKQFDRPQWHYIDIPQYLDPSDKNAFAHRLPVNIATDYPSQVAKENYNVVQAIAFCRDMLAKDIGADVKAQAYCWLLHLVGDIHQPLHSTAIFSVAHFPKGDKGGNEIKLTEGKNLHSVWDGLLGRDSRMQNIEKLARELRDRERFGAVWDTAASETDPMQWAKESHELCYAMVYDDAILAAVRNTPTGGKVQPISLPEEYYKQAGEQARKRVVAAGVRLGALLGGPSATTSPGTTRP